MHLLLMDPKRDREFQSALKTERVLSVHQQNVGTKKDVGSVGYEGDGQVQVLVFPKSLKQFSGARIVGIDYGVLEEENKSPRPRSRAPEKNRISKAPPRPAKQSKAPPAADKPAPKKSAAAPPPEPVAEPEPVLESDSSAARREVTREELIAGIRRALKALDEGKQVAAYRTLEQLL